jgi:hypothetical protein
MHSRDYFLRRMTGRKIADDPIFQQFFRAIPSKKSNLQASEQAGE